MLTGVNWRLAIRLLIVLDFLTATICDLSASGADCAGDGVADGEEAESLSAAAAEAAVDWEAE